MKRAQFTPGFAELRGNISGKQNLEYPTNDNKAYDGPVGKVNYARNYRASVIVSQRAKDGRMYFSIRTKSANHLTAKSKKAMALLGGSGAVYAALIKSPTLKAQAEAVYAKAQEFGEKRSFREYLMSYIRQMIVEHSASKHIVVSGVEITFDNPWGKFDGDLNINIAQATRVKFWTELVTNGIEFTVDGMKGVTINGVEDTFDDILTGNYNVLPLSRDGAGNLRFGSATGAYVYDNGYVNVDDEPIAGHAYTTTDVAPE